MKRKAAIVISNKNDILRDMPKSILNIKLESSYMAESMVVLPLFVAFMTVLLFFFRVIQVQKQVDNALIQTGRELSVISYEAESGYISDNFLSAKLLLQKNLKGSKASEQFIYGGIQGISLIYSDFEGSYITLTADYKMKNPVALPGNYKLAITQHVKCRKWTGRGKDNDKLEEEIVYITPNGTVYHKDKNCTYIKPRIKSILASQIEDARNEDGSKYYPCSLCKRSKQGNIVYVSSYGKRYHNIKDCKGIKRTVNAVFLSQVGDRHECSKCGG